LLFARQVVLSSGGWDETLEAFQDVDFKLRCLLNGAAWVRVNHIGFYYRLYGSASVSKRTSLDAFSSQLRVLSKVEGMMQERGILANYRFVLAKSYNALAKRAVPHAPAVSADAFQCAQQLAGTRVLDHEGTRIHRLLSAVIGAERKEQLASFLARHGIGRSTRKAYLDL
ncbi:MAG: hypothetical protein KC547_10150, partial [Anaerolineae bacterium]|nr:hypothetical protein [Anaerolineae bacterium]